MLTTQFLTGGKAIFTVEPSAASIAAGFKPHYTYRVRRGEGSFAAMYLLDLMTGSDNSSDAAYTYLAVYEPKTGTIRHTQGSCRPADSKSFRVAARAIAAIHTGREGMRRVEDAGWKLHHEGRCCCCGRRLTVPASIETGIGPECETFAKLGMAPCEVPCRTSRAVAKLQYAYWLAGDDSALVALVDVAQDELQFDAARATLYATATRKLMRKHKKGAKLPSWFVTLATR